MSVSVVKAPYAARWRVYAAWTSVSWLLLLAWLAYPLSPRPSLLMLVVWALVFQITSIVSVLWRCPRCRNRFFWSGLRKNPFASKCLHCGLPKWSRSDPAA